MIPCSWQGILCRGEKLVRVLGAQNEKECAQNSQCRDSQSKLLQGSSVCSFTVLSCLVSGWILQLWGRLQWAWECPVVDCAIISSTHLLDLASYRKTAVSIQWSHLVFSTPWITWDNVPGTVNSTVTPVVITQGLADHQEGLIDTITILKV